MCAYACAALVWCTHADVCPCCVPQSPKGANLRKIVRGEFKRNSAVEDPAAVEALKSNAVRALTNYLMLESSNKDEKLKERISDFNRGQMGTIKKDKE
jgi:hypothetical protein